jgi:putative ABC transport system permease protein
MRRASALRAATTALPFAACVAAATPVVAAPTVAQPTAVSDLLLADRSARALGVGPGDTLEVAGDAAMHGARRFRIADVYRPRPDPFEVGYGRLNLAMHLPDLEALLDDEDRVDRFVLKLRNPAERDAVVADLNRAAYGMRAYTSEDLAERGAATFVVVSQFHAAIGIVSLLAGLVFLGAIMVLKVEEMRRELGALRLLGISRRTVLRCVVVIAALVAALGSLLGIGLGLAAIAVINPLAQARYDTDLVFARPTPSAVALTCALAIAMGVLAGTAVAMRLVRGRALEQVGR